MDGINIINLNLNMNMNIIILTCNKFLYIFNI